MMCLTNDGVERKARTRNTDDDRVGSTKSECVRWCIPQEADIPRHRKGRRASLQAGVQKAQGPEIADPLETAISAPAPGAAEPLKTRKIQKCFLSSLEAGREEKRGGNHWLVVEAVRPILR